MPLLEGLDGVNKMSKSLNNYIGIEDEPPDMFGKLMSISDELMWRYIELLSFESLTKVDLWKTEVKEGRNPRDIKVMFAQEIVTRFHDDAAATHALQDFESRFRQGCVPNDMAEYSLDADNGTVPVVNALKLSGLAASSSEAIRAIQQGGVRINGAKVDDRSAVIISGETVVLQLGKRKFARITIN